MKFVPGTCIHSACRFFYLAAILTVLSLYSCKKENGGPPEAILFNDTIDWGWELGEWYGGNSFFWWHYPPMGVEYFGEMPGNWKEPNDFEKGHFHFRFEG